MKRVYPVQQPNLPLLLQVGTTNSSWRRLREKVATKLSEEEYFTILKNYIVCWNYLYLSQKLAEITDPTLHETLLQAILHGSVVAWRHLNLLGEYNFSEAKLQDTVGIKPPKFLA